MMVMAIGQPSAATASPSHARFEAQSKGLPLASELGHWIAEDDQATLIFTGGHVAGSGTSFVAEWSTGVLPGDARFSGSGTLVSGLQDDAVIHLHKFFRYKIDSDRWSHWLRSSFRMKGGFTYREDYEQVLIVGAPPKRVQYQWKLTGRMKDPALLTGQFDLTAD
jgi:hypothetical protein